MLSCWMGAKQVVLRDLRFAGYVDVTTSVSDGDPLPRSTGDRFPVVISVHSDTAGFDFVAQVTKRGIIAVSPLVLRHREREQGSRA